MNLLSSTDGQDCVDPLVIVDPAILQHDHHQVSTKCPDGQGPDCRLEEVEDRWRSTCSTYYLAIRHSEVLLAVRQDVVILLPGAEHFSRASNNRDLSRGILVVHFLVIIETMLLEDVPGGGIKPSSHQHLKLEIQRSTNRPVEVP